MTTSAAEVAERLADLQSREAALEAAQASLDAQLQQLHSEEQASLSFCRSAVPLALPIGSQKPLCGLPDVYILSRAVIVT